MTTPDPKLGLLAAPATLAGPARTFAAPLIEAAGDNLRALYMYGSALELGFDPRISDVNLLLLVGDLGFAKLEALARAARTMPRTRKPGETRYTPLVLTEAQLRTGADVFPVDALVLIER